MDNNWKAIFYFTKAERNGLFVLAALCLILLFLPTAYSWVFPAPAAIDFSGFEQEVNALLTNHTSKVPEPKIIPKTKVALFPFDPNTISKAQLGQLGLAEKTISNIINYRNKGGRFFKKEDLQKIYSLSPEAYQSLAPFIQIKKDQDSAKTNKTATPLATANKTPIIDLHPFDPNTASKEELLRLGIAPKPVNTILKFRSKGGSFRKKEDLQKIFGITPADYQRLETYISIPNNAPSFPPTTSTKQSTSPKKETITSIDINQSSSEDWQKIKGIGPAYAKKIIKWREKLGGFSSPQQVGDAYGLPDSVFQKILPLLQTSPVLQKIPINRISSEDLQKHPYLNFKQAKAITNYRQNHGPFKEWKELEKVRALSPETLNKVKPYIDFN